jgi:hypothetical protein
LTAGDALAFAAAASVALLAVRLPWDSVTAPRLSAGGAVVLAVLAWLLGRSAAPRPRWLWGVAGAALLLEGTARVLPGASREVAWAALVVLGAVAGRSRPLLAWLAPLFAAALCWSTGDVGVAVGWVDPAGDGWGPVLRSAAAEAVLAGSYLVLAGRTASPTSGRALRGCLLVFAALGATALGVRAAATGVLAAGLDVRVLTAVRIAAPTAVALGLVLVARVPRLPEMRIVGLAMAAAAALQVVGRDLLGGSPASRVAGFLVLGGGLIGATLLLRRRDPNEGDRATLPRGPVPGPSVEAAAPTARAGPETRAADPATGSAPATAATEGVGRVQVEVGEAAEPQDADRADGEPAQQSDGSPRRARRVTHLRTEL